MAYVAGSWVNGNAILDQNLMPGTNSNLYPYAASAVVSVGDKVDFVVDPYGNNGFDRTTFTAQIVPEPGMLALLAVGGPRGHQAPPRLSLLP